MPSSRLPTVKQIKRAKQRHSERYPGNEDYFKTIDPRRLAWWIERQTYINNLLETAKMERNRVAAHRRASSPRVANGRAGR